MENNLEKYQYLKEYMRVTETELNKKLRMVNAIMEDVESSHNMRRCPELCLDVRDQAVRIHSNLESRLVALQDLIGILRGYGIEI